MSAADCLVERTTHENVRRNVLPTATVLELGARYGTTSCAVALVQNNSGKLLSVEPDGRVWGVLTQNLDRHKCNVTVIHGFVGQHAYAMSRDKRYSTTFSGVATNTTPSWTLHELEEARGLHVDTLLIDCEGCVDKFLDGTPDILRRVHTILIEADAAQDALKRIEVEKKCRPKCTDYGRVILRLQEAGFRLMDRVGEKLRIFGRGRTAIVSGGMEYAFINLNKRYMYEERNASGYFDEGSVRCHPISEVDDRGQGGGWWCALRGLGVAPSVA